MVLGIVALVPVLVEGVGRALVVDVVPVTLARLVALAQLVDLTRLVDLLLNLLIFP